MISRKGNCWCRSSWCRLYLRIATETEYRRYMVSWRDDAIASASILLFAPIRFVVVTFVFIRYTSDDYTFACAISYVRCVVFACRAEAYIHHGRIFLQRKPPLRRSLEVRRRFTRDEGWPGCSEGHPSGRPLSSAVPCIFVQCRAMMKDDCGVSSNVVQCRAVSCSD